MLSGSRMTAELCRGKRAFFLVEEGIANPGIAHSGGNAKTRGERIYVIFLVDASSSSQGGTVERARQHENVAVVFFAHLRESGVEVGRRLLRDLPGESRLASSSLHQPLNQELP